MNRQIAFARPDIVRRVIGVWMPDSMGANSFHYTLVVPPIHWPIAHVMIRWIVNDAMMAATLAFVVNVN